jgi:hypothetical protein
VAHAKSSFGSSVAVDGETITVGVPLADVGGLADAGLAYRFRREESGAWTLVDTLTRPGAAAGDRFGQSVAARGGLVAVGAPKAKALGLSGSGEVRVYREESLLLVDHLVEPGWIGAEARPADHAAGERFGSSVALAEDGLVLVGGSPLDTVGGIAGRGSAAVLFFDGAAWQTLDRLTLPPDGTSASRFGTAVALAPWSFLVGGPKHTPPAGGTVREFTLPPP